MGELDLDVVDIRGDIELAGAELSRVSRWIRLTMHRDQEAELIRAAPTEEERSHCERGERSVNSATGHLNALRSGLVEDPIKYPWCTIDHM